MKLEGNSGLFFGGDVVFVVLDEEVEVGLVILLFLLLFLEGEELDNVVLMFESFCCRLNFGRGLEVFDEKGLLVGGFSVLFCWRREITR